MLVTANGAPEARVTSDGRLTIAGQEITVTAGQRSRLISCNDAATGVLARAAATGAAGARVGVAAVSGVAAGLATGDLSELKAKVEEQVRQVRRAATKICGDLAGMRATQEALAVQVAEFKPYAVVSVRESTDCAKHLHQSPAG